MPPQLRPVQQRLEADCYGAWDAGAHNVMAVAATGFGKTVVLSKILQDEPGASVAIAHRQELVSQISLALAQNGVRHRVVGARKGSPLVRMISAIHVKELGYSYVDPTAKTGVGGVDTIIKMTNEPWFQQVRLQVHDEGHHVLRENKWGRASTLFPRARGLFPTATPRRADGRGLGRHADGVTDALVLAPGMRDIINMGYLCDYRIICPKSNFRRENIRTSQSTGDVVKEDASREVKGSTITGDIVEHYLKWAPGKLGLTFAVDVEEASKLAVAFNARGVRAEMVHAKTPDEMRIAIIRKFRAREIQQIVNVDLFGEGFDVPACEVVSFGRPSDSFAIYTQQFGRPLRLLIPEQLKGNGIWDSLGDEGRKRAIAGSSKPYGMIIDHVGQVLRMSELGYGLPDSPQSWTLDRRERRAKQDVNAIPLRVCVACLQPYEAVKKRCPYCDHYMPPAQRGAPEFVAGDLTELDPSALAALRGEIKRIEGEFHPPLGLAPYAVAGARARWRDRQDGQRALRSAVAWWAGLQAHQGYSESESYRRFFFRYGVDVANAQLLGAREAGELADRINLELSQAGVDVTVN